MKDDIIPGLQDLIFAGINTRQSRCRAHGSRACDGEELVISCCVQRADQLIDLDGVGIVEGQVTTHNDHVIPGAGGNGQIK
jgi:hypothetical protein